MEKEREVKLAWTMDYMVPGPWPTLTKIKLEQAMWGRYFANSK